MNREERAKKAHETLDIFNRGSYKIHGNNVVCKSCFTTNFIPEEQLDEIVLSSSDHKPHYEVVNESVVTTILREAGQNCGVLNFASAKNPGGGFLNGSIAQEEALAVSSDLYLSQLQAQRFYDINRQNKSALYTHNMIYSSQVTFIRDERLNLLHKPVMVNVLTSPAVNAGAYYKNESGSKAIVLSVMDQRIKYILSVFASKGDAIIILGAFGCGVFQNDASDVAHLFHKNLMTVGLERHFKRIIFAIYDKKGDQYNAFKQKFI